MTVRKNKAGTCYVVDFMIAGKRYVKTIPEARLKPQALLVEAKMRDEIFNKKYNPQVGTADFCKFVEEKYLPHSRKTKRSFTFDEYFYNVILEHFKGMKFADITKEVVRNFRDARAAEETQRGGLRCESTVNRELAQLSAIFSLAKREYDLCDFNPVKEVTKFTVDNKRTRVLYEDEETALMPALPYRIGRIAQLVLNTGMRRGEMMKLRIGNLDFEAKKTFGMTIRHGRIVLPKTITKGKRERTIPMNRTAREILLEFVGGDDRPDRKVFIGHGYHPTTISEGFAAVCDEVGLPDVTMHTLRHTFATRLAERGVPVSTIQSLLGHSDKETAKALGVPEVTTRYIHTQFNAMQDAVDLLVKVDERAGNDRGLSTATENG